MKEPLTRIELGLIHVYRGAICPACGNAKESRRLFCKTCYFSLDVRTRNSIHVRIDDDCFYDTYLKVIDRLVKAGVGVSFDRMPLESRRILDEAGLADALWHQPMKLWIVLDNGKPLTVKSSKESPLYAAAFKSYEQAYAMRQKRRKYYWSQANAVMNGVDRVDDLDARLDAKLKAKGYLALANGVTVMRVEAQ